MTGSSFLGVDRQGLQGWTTSLTSAHEDVITALNKYQTIAQQNNQYAHGQHFVSLNSQCQDITKKHLSDHNDLHAQYLKATNDLVTGIENIAGG